jgi:hypothetical protein
MIDVAIQESLDDNHFPPVSTEGMGDEAIIRKHLLRRGVFF